MMMLSVTLVLALALVLVVLMMAVLPTGRDFFAVIPAAMAIGGVAIIVAAVFVAAAASLSVLLSLSFSSLSRASLVSA